MSPRAQINLTKILEAAIDTCNQEGFEQLSLASISNRLGIKTPSLYNHIQGLSDLKQKMAIHGMQLLYDTVTLAAVGFAGENAIISVSKAYIEFVHKHSCLYQSISKAPNPREQEFDALSNQLVQIDRKSVV